MKKNKFFALGLYVYLILIIDICILISFICLIPYSRVNNFNARLASCVILGVSWIGWTILLIMSLRKVEIDDVGITTTLFGKKKKFIEWTNIKRIESNSTIFFLRLLCILEEDRTALDYYYIKEIKKPIILANGYYIKKAIKQFYSGAIIKERDYFLQIFDKKNKISLIDELHLLKNAVQFISMDFADQVKILSDSIDKENPAELSGIWYFEGIEKAYYALLKSNVLTEKTKSTFQELNDAFKNINLVNGENVNEIWNLKAMEEGKFWAEQRSRAKKLVEELLNVDTSDKD